MAKTLTLILGGAASGKSAFAEKIVLGSGLKPTYIATAQAFDDEMREKISRHVAARGSVWNTLESPLALPETLRGISPDQSVLIDCLTLWLSNLLLMERDIELATQDLMSALQTCPAPVTMVSNEVGQGIVPDNALSRQFREAQGRLNIEIAAQADRVAQLVAGLPNVLKGSFQ